MEEEGSQGALLLGVLPAVAQPFEEEERGPRREVHGDEPEESLGANPEGPSLSSLLTEAVPTSRGGPPPPPPASSASRALWCRLAIGLQPLDRVCVPASDKGNTCII